VIEIDNIRIGINIKKARTNKKLTQQQLADAIDKTESSIRKYEKGLVQVPNDVLQQIGNALDVPIYELMGFDEIIDTKDLSEEVELVEQIEKKYGKDSAELVHYYSILDDQGKEKAFDYVYYLAEQKQKNNEKMTPGVRCTKDQDVTNS